MKGLLDFLTMERLDKFKRRCQVNPKPKGDNMDIQEIEKRLNWIEKEIAELTAKLPKEPKEVPKESGPLEIWNDTGTKLSFWSCFNKKGDGYFSVLIESALPTPPYKIKFLQEDALSIAEFFTDYLKVAKR